MRNSIWQYSKNNDEYNKLSSTIRRSSIILFGSYWIHKMSDVKEFGDTLYIDYISEPEIYCTIASIANNHLFKMSNNSCKSMKSKLSGLWR